MKRRLSLIIMVLMMGATAFAQQAEDSTFDISVGNLTEQVEVPGLKYYDVNRSMSSEFFMIEILFDTAGGISSTMLLANDSIHHRQHFQERVLPMLKESWVKCKSKFTGLLIPVFIAHHLPSDASNTAMGMFDFYYRAYSQVKQTGGIYLTRPIPIVYLNLRKQTPASPPPI